MNDAEYMAMTLELAAKAIGKVSPDPLVGAVIVNNSEIVGTGYYAEYGAPHAEAVAINEAGDKCKGGTIYTNLEPCCHFGKNPPCTDAIIEVGIRRVVSAMHDPNPKVDSNGFATLRAAGIKVEIGLMEDEARELNEPFFKFITTQLPYVVLSIAQTSDGRIAQPDGHSQWITCKESRTEVHRMRATYDAVMVGANTVRVDNPQLTVRHVDGRHPKRIIVAGSKLLSQDFNVFTDSEKARTIVACTPDQAEHYSRFDGITVWEIDKSSDGYPSLTGILIRAAHERIASILLQGGSFLTSSFLAHKLIDKIHVFTAPIILGTGLPSVQDIGMNRLDRSIRIRGAKYRQVGDDIVTTGYPEWR
jgi:diaminohydroxyphosphoribosylaminopyrimidine deaminase/5-amino-6-(5-phosphoribosylamino)uracil reductase